MCHLAPSQTQANAAGVMQQSRQYLASRQDWQLRYLATRCHQAGSCWGDIYQ
jgi:hypothetical protein